MLVNAAISTKSGCTGVEATGREGPLPVIRMNGLLTNVLSLAPVGPCSPGFQSQQRDALNKTMVTLSWKGEGSHLAQPGLLCQWIRGPRRGCRGDGIKRKWGPAPE